MWVLKDGCIYWYKKLYEVVPRKDSVPQGSKWALQKLAKGSPFVLPQYPSSIKKQWV